MYSIFRDLAIIILSAKFFCAGRPQVQGPAGRGRIIAGLLIGPCLLNLVQTSDSISIFAEIGVVLLMFTTGLGTNLKELMRAYPIATLIACVGVFVAAGGRHAAVWRVLRLCGSGQPGVLPCAVHRHHHDGHQRVPSQWATLQELVI